MVSHCDDSLMTGQEFVVIKCMLVVKTVLTKWYPCKKCRNISVPALDFSAYINWSYIFPLTETKN